jgi:hypothetical protein
LKPDQPKLCECGCGQPAPLATRTRSALGWVKGEPLRFVIGHWSRGAPVLPPNPSGLCQCGCGATTALAARTSRRDGLAAGEHVRFVSGHNARGSTATPEKRRKTSESKRGERNPSWRGDAVGYNAIHSWLSRRHPRRGVCDHCGKSTPTQYAFLRHPEPHTRQREDYAELCSSCHLKLDYASGQRRRRRS